MSTPAALHTEIANLQPGDHLCCIYETDEEHRTLLTSYLRQGLERNEKVVYIVDARTAEIVLGYLREDDLDPRPYLDREQWVILTVSDAYMREGAFIPDRMISFLRQETDRAVGEGYGALRATGEMSWALRRLPGSHHLIEYESKLNRFLPGSRCLALCQYDKRRFSPEILLQVLATHPIAVIGTETFENVHYVSPEVFLTHDFSTAVLGHWIEDLRLRKRSKAVEDALRKSKALLEQTQRITMVGGWEYDVAARRIYWTDEVYRIYEVSAGYDPNDIHQDFDFYSPQDRAAIEGAFRRAVEEGEPYDLELQFIGARGTRKWVRTTAEVESVSGKSVRVFGNIQDITDRKRAEERMRHAQKLESLGVLAGGIAHDFNNRLMAIMGHTDLALAELPPVSPVREHLKEVEKASHRAADLCRQMLAYSGKGRFVIGSLDLGEVVKEMAGMLAMSISKKAILQYRFSPDLPRIEADASQIRQVVMNLIINASEAIGDNPGVISLATGAMECDRAYLRDVGAWEELPEGRYVFLEVTDTGSGMDKETQKKIFDPFFTTKFIGRGLGLAAALGIVRGHRGTIKVYSEKGKGSTFKVLFPATGTVATSSSVPMLPKEGWT